MKQKNKIQQIKFIKDEAGEKLLPYFIELQRKSFEDFLQKDVPLEEKKLIGIHGALVEVFGMAGCSDLYIEKLPEDKDKRNKAIKFLSYLSKRGIHDVLKIVQYKLPVLKNVKDAQLKQIKSQLKELEVECDIKSSGLTIQSGETTVTLQYNGYTLTEPKYPIDDSKEARF
ncbi:MAG: hypothetical protein NZ839_02670, partial [Endomicrobia bacterium]|nr:hypothetical protein [Endomicrobiia bacterium]